MSIRYICGRLLSKHVDIYRKENVKAFTQGLRGKEKKGRFKIKRIILVFDNRHALNLMSIIDFFDVDLD